MEQLPNYKTGNVAQYKKWAKEFKGVGSVLLEPLWNGANTVRLSITDGDGNEASSELVCNFQKFIAPEPKGHGLGVAPIGAHVTVQSMSGFVVTVSAQVKIEEDPDIEIIIEVLFSLLVIVGVVNDPITKGVKDNEQALNYEKPK